MDFVNECAISGSELSNWLLIILHVVAGGAIGGSALFLSMRLSDNGSPSRPHEAKGRSTNHWGHATKETLRYSFIGVAASAATLAFIDPVFGVNFDQTHGLTITSSLRLLSLSILSGFAGIGLIRRLSSAFMQRVESLAKETKELSNTVRNTSHSDWLTDEAIKKFEEKEYDIAIDYASRACDLNSENFRALIVKGRAYHRLGKTGDALKIAEQVVNIAPDYDASFYNRACYKNRLGYPLNDVLADLRKSISLLPANRQIAATDPDFQSIWEDPQFKKLVNPA